MLQVHQNFGFIIHRLVSVVQSTIRGFYHLYSVGLFTEASLVHVGVEPVAYFYPFIGGLEINNLSFYERFDLFVQLAHTLVVVDDVEFTVEDLRVAVSGKRCDDFWKKF